MCSQLPYCVCDGEDPRQESSNAAPANRSTAQATANVGDDRPSMGSGPMMGIVTGGSDPTYPAWQTIEVAPKDGTPVLLGFQGNLHALVGHCEMEYWGELNSDFEFVPFSVKPTHWMFLPPSPPRSIGRVDREGGWNADRGLSVSRPAQNSEAK